MTPVGPRRLSREEQSAQAAAAEAARKQADQARMSAEETARGPGYRAVSQGTQEARAGVVAPGYEGTRDRATGQLLDPFKSNAYAGEALQKLKGQAFAEGDSPWAQMQLQKQALEQGGARDQAAQSQAQGIAQAQANLMRQGGLSSGARTRMAMQGAKDLARQQQEVARQGIGQRLGIQEQDLARKTDLLGKFGDAESSANEKNIGRLSEDVNRGGNFDMERYKQQMSAFGASETAKAQRAAAGAGSKCFAEWTEVLMADFSTKKITEIKVGDEVLAGGKVLETIQYHDGFEYELYDYKGVNLTGSHAVKECGKWKRVSASMYGMKLNKSVNIVYTLITENHFIISNKVVFSDDIETNDNYVSEIASLAALNLGI